MAIDFTPDESSAPKIDFTPDPQMPDTSGAQRMAKDNLAANDNKETPENGEPKPPPTPTERLNTAIGMPVDGIINGQAKPTDVNPDNRRQYIKAIQNGSATSGPDWLQSMIHSVVPLVAGAAKNTEAAGNVAKAVGQSIGPAYEAGTVIPPDPESNVRTIAASAFNIPFQAAMVVYSAFQQAATQAGIEYGVPAVGRDVALLPESMMATNLHPALPKSWNDLPGKDVVVDHVAKKLGKDPSAVTPTDINQAIAEGGKDLMPAAKDFKNVATVSGVEESTLHVIYNETGVKPDQVFEDARNNPAIANDVANGRVPEAYEHLIEPPTIPAERLNVARSETAKAFNVVDEQGDHVVGGFESAEEARHYIEDQQFKAEERAAIEAEGKGKKTEEFNKILEEQRAKEGLITAVRDPETRKIYTGASHYEAIKSSISDGQEIHDRLMGLYRVHDIKNEGFIDERGKFITRDQTEKKYGIRTTEGIKGEDRTSGFGSGNIVPPSSTGKPTSLRTFLSNNGAKFNEANELISIKSDGKIIKGEAALERANEIAKEHGYLENGKTETDLANLIQEKNGGREHFRDADAARVAKAEEARKARESNDPVRLEHEAHNVGIDTERLNGETDRQFIDRLKQSLKDFYSQEQGSGITIRDAIGKTITTAEKWAGKLTGDLFEKLGNAYIKTFQPELAGDKALRADAYMAKYKASLQEAENSFYSASAKEKAAWDKKTSDQRMEWLYDHETGRWNEEENPDHARYQALLDATFKEEKKSIGSDAETGYKENYLPHAWEKPDAVRAFFNSEAMIKKYGKDGFTKASTFQLIQDGIRAGFKLKTNNPESMLVSRLLAGHNMMATMNLLKDMESSGIAKRATIFSVDKRIAKTQAMIDELQVKYKKEFEKKNDPRQSTMEGIPPAESKVMQVVEKRLTDLKERLDNLNKEKSENKLTPEEMKELKAGFKVIGPDSKVWNISQQVAPLWKNAMEMKGLWENQGLTGDAYRGYMQGKAIWTQVKLGLSLFHPLHVAIIDLASDIAALAHHLIQGGKLSDIATGESLPNFGLTKDTLKIQDHPAVTAWKTAPDARTPEQNVMVQHMVEGGMNPIMSARDTVHFKENFNKAISGLGVNNLRLIATAASLPGLPMKPFFEHWIPGMKAEIYLRRAELALKRDPSLATDAGKRGEVFRQIAKDTDRTYGEMNNDVQFWNRNVRDSFNASFISGGWKLAQLYNARGLLQPGKIAYKFAKTGEFSKSDITFNMLQSYAYTALTLATGAAVATVLGTPIRENGDDVWDIVKNLVAPQTGEKNPDGTPIRLNQPAFAKEAYMLAKEINTKGILAGTGAFVWHSTLGPTALELPPIAATLHTKDFTGREIISDPTDLNQWTSAGWNAINPMSLSNYEKAEAKGSDVGKVAGLLGFPLAGAYLNQTAFEQKVLHTYSEQNPPKDDAYTHQLKIDLKSAVAEKKYKEVDEIKEKMKSRGMTPGKIASAQHVFTKKFVDMAWDELSKKDQMELIKSASEEEKKKYRIKP